MKVLQYNPADLLSDKSKRCRPENLYKVFNNQDEMLKTIKTEYSTLMNVLTESNPVEAVKEKATVSENVVKEKATATEKIREPRANSS